MFKKLNTFVKESWQELVHKVTWPTWNELQSSAVVVMTASLIIALMIYVMDYTFSELVTLYYTKIAR